MFGGNHQTALTLKHRKCYSLDLKENVKICWREKKQEKEQKWKGEDEKVRIKRKEGERKEKER